MRRDFLRNSFGDFFQVIIAVVLTSSGPWPRLFIHLQIEAWLCPPDTAPGHLRTNLLDFKLRLLLREPRAPGALLLHPTTQPSFNHTAQCRKRAAAARRRREKVPPWRRATTLSPFNLKFRDMVSTPLGVIATVAGTKDGSLYLEFPGKIISAATCAPQRVKDQTGMEAYGYTRRPRSRRTYSARSTSARRRSTSTAGTASRRQRRHSSACRWDRTARRARRSSRRTTRSSPTRARLSNRAAAATTKRRSRRSA